MSPFGLPDLKLPAPLHFIDALTVYLIGAGVAVFLLALALRSVRYARWAAPAWLLTGLLGIVLGGGASLVASHYLGHHWTHGANWVDAPPGASQGPQGAMPPSGMPLGGMAPGAGGPPGGGGPGGGQRNAEPPTALQLLALVGKLDLLTQGLPFHLEQGQAEELAEVLSEIGAAAEMTGAQADAYIERIDAILNDQQQTALDSISLPRQRGGRGGAKGPAKGQPPTDNASPFQQAANKQRLADLLNRIGGKTPAGEKENEEKESDEKKNDEKKIRKDAEPAS